MKANLSEQEVDILNSKISETLVECLEKMGQAYKSEEDEYELIVEVKDEKHAKYRLEYIASELEEIIYNACRLEVFIFGASCKASIIEARRQAREVADKTNHQYKVEIYNAGK